MFRISSKDRYYHTDGGASPYVTKEMSSKRVFQNRKGIKTGHDVPLSVVRYVK